MSSKQKGDSVATDDLATVTSAPVTNHDMTERWHALKVVQPYFDRLWDGDKTFEVRKNDRGFQRGDLLRLREWDGSRCKTGCGGSDARCPGWLGGECVRRITFVYSGDPRFGGIEPGYVVLALCDPSPTSPHSDGGVS